MVNRGGSCVNSGCAHLTGRIGFAKIRKNSSKGIPIGSASYHVWINKSRVGAKKNGRIKLHIITVLTCGTVDIISHKGIIIILCPSKFNTILRGIGLEIHRHRFGGINGKFVELIFTEHCLHRIFSRTSIIDFEEILTVFYLCF